MLTSFGGAGDTWTSFRHRSDLYPYLSRLVSRIAMPHPAHSPPSVHFRQMRGSPGRRPHVEATFLEARVEKR